MSSFCVMLEMLLLFVFPSTNKTSNCMLCIFKLHLDEDEFGQPANLNRSYRQRAKQLNYR